jgi:hypothetical protein
MLGYFFRVPSASTLQPTNNASADAMLVSDTEASRSVRRHIVHTHIFGECDVVRANQTSANAADFAQYASPSSPGDVSSIDLSDSSSFRNEL